MDRQAGPNRQVPVEGPSLRSGGSVVGISINTVSKLLVGAGEACTAYGESARNGLGLN